MGIQKFDYQNLGILLNIKEIFTVIYHDYYIVHLFKDS